MIIGYHTDLIDSKILPKGEKLIEIETNNPARYINLKESEIYDDPLPEPADQTDKNSLSFKRQTLKNLFYEIQFTNEIGEDSTDLQAEYDLKLTDYNESKLP